MAEHTRGAVKAANIIINDKKYLQTLYGKKTAEGIADLIDIETHAPQLIKLLKQCQTHLETCMEIIGGEWGYENRDVYQIEQLLEAIREVIDA